MKLIFRLGLATLALILAAVPAAYSQNIVTFDVPGATGDTIPAAINSAGQITGKYVGLNSNGQSIYMGFLRERDGTITTFSTNSFGNRQFTQPLAMNSAGQITGTCASQFGAGFIRQPDGTITTFQDPNETHPYAINSAGQIVGTNDNASGPVGFLRDPATGNLVDFLVGFPTQPRGITPTGQISGYFGRRPGESLRGGGFVLDPQGTATTGQGTIINYPVGTLTLFTVTDSQTTFPQAMSTNGEIVGYYSDAQLANHGFLRWKNGTITTFSVQNATNTVATGVNQKGQVTGFYTDATFVYHGFVRAKNGTIITFDVPGSTNTYPVGINASGEITGWYADGNGIVHGFVGTP